MNIPIVPPPEEVLQNLTSLIPLLHKALDEGTQKAREYFDDYAVPVDPWLYPNIVRYWAKRYLEQAGHEVEYEPEPLANNGLCLTCGRFQIRILKGDDGSLPAPGISQRKVAFYQQQMPLFQDALAGEHTERVGLNLVVIWDVTSSYVLKDLVLACPRSGDQTHAEAYWSIPIPNPVASMVAEASESTITEDLDEITLRKPANTSDLPND